jgi:hypothetical protein
MSKKITDSLVVCLLVILCTTGCQQENGGQTIVPVTGKNAVPRTVDLARNNILEFVILSARIDDIPPSSEWTYSGQPAEGEFRFESSDWLMIVWPDDPQEASYRVVIRNEFENSFWCGYVDPDGHVVDTAYIR